MSPPEWLPKVSCPFPWNASLSGLPSFGPLYTVPRKVIYSMDSYQAQRTTGTHIFWRIFPCTCALLPAISQVHSRPDPVYFFWCTAGQQYWGNHTIKRWIFSISPLASVSHCAGASRKPDECPWLSLLPLISGPQQAPPPSTLSRGELGDPVSGR